MIKKKKKINIKQKKIDKVKKVNILHKVKKLKSAKKIIKNNKSDKVKNLAKIKLKINIKKSNKSKTVKKKVLNKTKKSTKKKLPEKIVKNIKQRKDKKEKKKKTIHKIVTSLSARKSAYCANTGRSAHTIKPASKRADMKDLPNFINKKQSLNNKTIFIKNKQGEFYKSPYLINLKERQRNKINKDELKKISYQKIIFNLVRKYLFCQKQVNKKIQHTLRFIFFKLKNLSKLKFRDNKNLISDRSNINKNEDKFWQYKLNQLAFVNLTSLLLVIIYKFIKWFGFVVYLFFLLLQKLKFYLKFIGKQIILELPRPTLADFRNKITNIVPRFEWQWAESKWKLGAFIIISFFIIIPVIFLIQFGNLIKVKGKVLGISEKALKEIGNGKGSLALGNTDDAYNYFQKAQNDFNQAQNDLEKTNQVILVLAKTISPKVKSGENLLQAGKEVSIAGENFSKLVEILNNLFDKNQTNILLTDKILKTKLLVNNIGKSLKTIKENLGNVDIQLIPKGKQKLFKSIKSNLAILQEELTSFDKSVDFLLKFLGAKKERRYLLLFQNNSEIRATGGFIGSLAVINIYKGEVKSLKSPAGGIYDISNKSNLYIKAPKPLRLINSRWQLQDSNWWPDFPSSAKKILYFWHSSKQPNVDGIITITPDVVEKLLAIIGPIKIKASNFSTNLEFAKQASISSSNKTSNSFIAITKDNFYQIVQKESEQKPNVTKQPKKIIGIIAEKILKKLPKKVNRNVLFKLLLEINTQLKEKNILFYFNDPDLQSFVENYGWDGKVKKTKGDFLMVINTNIGGGKSDRVVKQIINHQAKIMSDGSIIDKVIITKTHNGTPKSELEKIPKEKRGEKSFTWMKNISWMRFYLPKGSKLISAQGFNPPQEKDFLLINRNWKDDHSFDNEKFADINGQSKTKIYNEDGYTVFANWIQVEPGETVSAEITYQLPFKIKKQNYNSESPKTFMRKILNSFLPEKEYFNYSLFVQKQAGDNRTDLISGLKIDNKPKINVKWKYPKDLQINNAGWNIKTKLNQDKFYSIIF